VSGRRLDRAWGPQSHTVAFTSSLVASGVVVRHPRWSWGTRFTSVPSRLSSWASRDLRRRVLVVPSDSRQRGPGMGSSSPGERAGGARQPICGWWPTQPDGVAATPPQTPTTLPNRKLPFRMAAGSSPCDQQYPSSRIVRAGFRDRPSHYTSAGRPVVTIWLSQPLAAVAFRWRRLIELPLRTARQLPAKRLTPAIPAALLPDGSTPPTRHDASSWKLAPAPSVCHVACTHDRRRSAGRPPDEKPQNRGEGLLISAQPRWDGVQAQNIPLSLAWSRP